jgi:hypothetical protein
LVSESGRKGARTVPSVEMPPSFNAVTVSVGSRHVGERQTIYQVD